MNTYTKIAALLIDVEAELRSIGLWSMEKPSEEALASTQPFAVDTLSFPQWVQFIYIERMRFIIAQNLPLPQSSAIAPMSEEYFRTQKLSGYKLTDLFNKIDALFLP